MDIAEILFREILGFSSYPGSPFTGNIFQDIILYFFIPTVFLILFVYIASAIAVPPSSSKLRLLMALAIYSFILASRYFEGFAIFASRVYIPFIIVIAFIYFVVRHFRGAGGGGMKYEGGGAMAYENRGRSPFNPAQRSRLNKRLKELNSRIDYLEKQLSKARESKSSDAEVWAQELSALLKEKQAIEDELKIM